MCSKKDGDEVEVFVNHSVDEPIMGPTLLENVNHGDMKESGASFNTRPNFRAGEDYLNMENPFTSFSTSPPFNTTPHFTTTTSAAAPSIASPSAATVDDIDVGPTGSDLLQEEVEDSD
ncbi:hypothetical protein FXO38_28901 [Capsicum annuum]|nr:hypothetical protein FXO38_28901 [Capsicum annuum]KAF3641979.1 hypothetical protein FXO37_22725 [Capsicum annuum]